MAEEMWEQAANDIGMQPGAIEEIMKSPDYWNKLRTKGMTEKLVGLSPQYMEMYQHLTPESQKMLKEQVGQPIESPLLELASQVTQAQVPGPKLGTLRYTNIPQDIQESVKSGLFARWQQLGLPEHQASRLWDLITGENKLQMTVTGMEKTMKELGGKSGPAVATSQEPGRVGGQFLAPIMVALKQWTENKPAAVLHEIGHYLDKLTGRRLSGGDVGIEWQPGVFQEMERTYGKMAKKLGLNPYRVIAEEGPAFLVEPESFTVPSRVKVRDVQKLKDTMDVIISDLSRMVAP